MSPCPHCGGLSASLHQRCPVCGGNPLGGTAQSSDDPYLGMTIGSKFILRELIGTGGMGKVYRSDQIGVGRTVAVKIMHRHLLGDETAAARFTNEARASSHLNHPHSIAVLDFGQTEMGLLYIVMEYLRGRSLDTVLQTEFPIPFGRLASILCQAMDAVEAAHQLNIIHRDLKPENVFIEQSTGQDFVKVLDFGIAKMLDLEDRSITTPGLVPGTPEYMSPEQARGEPLDFRSDVYSLGVILYELLTGVVPFRGPSALATMMAQVQDPAEPPSKRCPDRQIPEALDALTLWALSKRSTERITSAAQFRDLLAAWAQVTGLWPADDSTKARLAEFLLQFFTREQLALPATSKAREVLARPAQALRLQPRTRAPSGIGLDEELLIFGRQAEQQRLVSFLTSTRPNRALRLQGPSGAGKSVLVRYAMRRAGELGLRVICCRPSPGWARTVLGPAHQVALGCLGVSRKTPEPEEVLMAAGRMGVGAEDVPGLKEIFGISSHLGELEADTRRRERVTAFRHLIHLAAARKPLLLVFEEIDRYDDPSRELILSLAAMPAAQPVAMLFTHSPDYTQLWPPEVELLEPAPLDLAARRELLRSLFAEEVDEEVLERMTQRGHGQPLFIEQMVYAEVHEGISTPPEKVADLVAARLERLSQEERDLLQWMAVFGDFVPLETLEAVRGEPVGPAILTLLASKGLIRMALNGYRFVHHLVTVVVYSSIPAEVRRRIHRQVAEHLRQVDAPVTSIAFHSYEAEDGPRAIDELDRAGAWAMKCFDLGAAATCYSRALNVVRSEWGKGRMVEADLDQTAVDLARSLASVLKQRDDVPAARGVLEETLSVAAGDEASRAGLRLDLGRIDLELGNLPRAVHRLELAHGDATSAGSDWLTGEVSRELARAVGLQNDRERAASLLADSLAASSRASGQRGVPSWSALLEVANTSIQIGFTDRARGYLLDALQEAENERDVLGKLQVVSRMAELHQSSNEWGEAEMRLTQALDLAGQVGDRTRKAKLLTDLGRIHRIQGEVESGRKALEQAVRTARTVGWWEGLKRAEAEIEMLKYARPQAL